jgi:hypothetical protein
MALGQASTCKYGQMREIIDSNDLLCNSTCQGLTKATKRSSSHGEHRLKSKEEDLY